MASIHEKIIKLLKAHPGGLTAGQIRELLALEPGEQSQLDRRRRDLYRRYVIERQRLGSVTKYIYRGETSARVEVAISLKTRAAVLNEAMGRCGMCGRSVEKEAIALVVDHRVPQDWGGTNDRSNLWAICEDCNAGKKAHFATFDSTLMQLVFGHKSVHVRIGELLKAQPGVFVPAPMISLVAGQADWMKRTRELRYLGWKIETRRSTEASGQVIASYRLTAYADWPADPTGWIRDFERERSRRGKGLK